MTEFQQGVLRLIRYALAPEDHFASLPDDFSYTDLLKFAHMQQVIPLLYYGACKTDAFLRSEALMMFVPRIGGIVAHSYQQMQEFDALAHRFEEEGIDYMPVKGTVLKRLYQTPEMRVMGDSDILIRQQQFARARAIMTELGYICEEEVNHCCEYKSPGGMVIELHRQLLPDGELDLAPYYRDGWWTARPDADVPHRYEMRPEDHYVFLIAHFVKHYRGFGAGIKFVIDFRVFENAYPDLDMEYVQGELVKLGLDEFYANIRRTMAVWFDGADPDEITDYLTDRLFNNTVFGAQERGLVSEAYQRTKLEQSQGKESADSARRRSKWFELFFLPYSAMKKKYPVLQKWAILLPIFWIVRGFDILFFHRDKISQVDEDLEQIRQENVDAYRRELNYVGLDKDTPEPANRESSVP